MFESYIPFHDFAPQIREKNISKMNNTHLPQSLLAFSPILQVQSLCLKTVVVLMPFSSLKYWRKRVTQKIFRQKQTVVVVGRYVSVAFSAVFNPAYNPVFDGFPVVTANASNHTDYRVPVYAVHGYSGEDWWNYWLVKCGALDHRWSRHIQLDCFTACGGFQQQERTAAGRQERQK